MALHSLPQEQSPGQATPGSRYVRDFST